jgi:ABC-type uncharacterized transport system permease subunit
MVRPQGCLRERITYLSWLIAGAVAGALVGMIIGWLDGRILSAR